MLNGNLVALIPVDTSGLPAHDDLVIPKPSTAHTKIVCGCTREAWIGPQQLLTVISGAGTPACYYCIADMMRAGVDIDIVNVTALNPSNDELPRRS